MPDLNLQSLFDELSRDAASTGPGASAAVASAGRRRRARASAAALALAVVAGGAALALQPSGQQVGLKFADDPAASTGPTPASPTASPTATTPGSTPATTPGSTPASTPGSTPGPTSGPIAPSAAPVLPPPPPQPTGPPPTPSAQPPSGLRPVTLYYVADVGTGLRLYRETHLRPATTAVVRDAVTAMFDQAPFDDDYVTPWDPATRVLDVKIAGDVATVDLNSAAATTRGGSEAAEMAVAQLVWTVHAAAPDVRAVRILIEGKAPADFWGSLALVEPVERAPAQDVLAPVWLDLAPQRDGDPVTVSRGDSFGGEASVFEAAVSWEWVRDGEVVDKGFSTADQGAPGRGVWSATVDVPPGNYVLRAFSSSAEDGRPMFVDDKGVRVIG
ncbi:MAG: GerMN domain-containing protein [Mycobacteriales bacterium]